jgi:menaquinone-9 beta-reductase
MQKYEVIIIGAGPAGLSTAIHLKNNGIKDLCVIERSCFPRVKPCAGLLPKKAYEELQELGIDAFDDLKYISINNYQVYYKYKLKLKMNNIFGFTTNLSGTRLDLDMALYNKAKELKISIIENSKIENVDLNSNLIKTLSEEYQYNYLVFADGMSGYSARFKNKATKKNICFEAYVKEKSESPLVELHFGITNNGYAWIGKTGTNVNIGFSDIYDKNINYKELLKNFAKIKGYKINDKDIKGAFTPYEVNNSIILNNNVYFVGDAAGITDPLSIEGIYYALATGKYCAMSIKNKDNNLYLKKVKPFIKRFNNAKKVMNKFYKQSFQWLIWNIVSKIFPRFIAYGFEYLMLENKYDYNEIFKCFKSYIKSNKKD